MAWDYPIRRSSGLSTKKLCGKMAGCIRTSTKQTTSTSRRIIPTLDRGLEGAVLQLCRSALICSANAPCVIGFRSVQVEAIRTGSYPSGGWLVSAFSLSYRDVEELLADRGLHADHVTVWRWVQRYAPEMECRLRSGAQTDQRKLAGGRNLHTSQGEVALP